MAATATADLRATITKRKTHDQSKDRAFDGDNIRVLLSRRGDKVLLVGDMGVDKVLVCPAKSKVCYEARVTDLVTNEYRPDSFGQRAFTCKITVPALRMANVSVVSGGPLDSCPSNVVEVDQVTYYTQEWTYPSLGCVDVVPYPATFLFDAGHGNTLCVRLVGRDCMVYFGDESTVEREEVKSFRTEDNGTLVIVTKAIGTLFILPEGLSHRVVEGPQLTVEYELLPLDRDAHTVTEAVVVRRA